MIFSRCCAFIIVFLFLPNLLITPGEKNSNSLLVIVETTIANQKFTFEIKEMFKPIAKILNELGYCVDLMNFCCESSLNNGQNLEVLMSIFNHFPKDVRDSILLDSVSREVFERFYKELRILFRILLQPTNSIGKMIKELNQKYAWDDVISLSSGRIYGKILIIIRELIFACFKVYMNLFGLLYLYDQGIVKKHSSGICFVDNDVENCFLLVSNVNLTTIIIQDDTGFLQDLEIKIDNIRNLQKRLIDPNWHSSLTNFTDIFTTIYKALRERGGMALETKSFCRYGSLMGFCTNKRGELSPRLTSPRCYSPR